MHLLQHRQGKGEKKKTLKINHKNQIRQKADEYIDKWLRTDNCDTKKLNGKEGNKWSSEDTTSESLASEDDREQLSKLKIK